MHSNSKDNLIVQLTFEFALEIIEITAILEERKKFVLANQLLRSGTSIGANVREGQNAESKSDFIHKLKISAKEADETEYWLLLCKMSKVVAIDCQHLIEKLNVIQRILSKIIATSKLSLSEAQKGNNK